MRTPAVSYNIIDDTKVWGIYDLEVQQSEFKLCHEVVRNITCTFNEYELFLSKYTSPW